MKKPIIRENIKIEKIVGGGQGLGRLTSGKKIFAWNALKDEVIDITLTKKKSSLEEGIATEIKESSKDRITPKDPDSYLSTSPWQILDWQKENALKASLIHDSLKLNQVELNQPISMFSDNKPYNYRNKIEFSFFWDKNEDQLFLAFFKRGSHNKIKVEQTSLAKDEINQAAKQILELLRKKKVAGFSLKTLLLRNNQNREVVAQLYIKDLDALQISEEDFKNLNIRVKSDMRVYASCPFAMPEERVAEFIRIKRGWIDRSLAKMKEMRKAEERRKAERRDPSRIANERKELETIIRERLPIYENLTGLYASGWHIREMKTRWGSCNTKIGRLCFNLLLVKTPAECIDYVILHELAHIEVPNHSKEFWRIVERYMPDYRERRKKLKEFVF